ncbi:MAG: RDD family protein [Campylobacteraceae bacterium]|jgi:uncharacterized RDD family membrane protein YckC|nr:RDD family protein [Campylobacteraceae bacterium]
MRWRDIRQGKIKPKPVSFRTAVSISKRVKAFIIDMFMINMPILYFAVYIVLGGRDEFLNNQLAIFICTLAFGVILSIFFATAGQSPGYKAYGIRLADMQTKKKLGFFRAMWRFVCFVIFGALLIGFLPAFFRDDKRCLHDIFSDTACYEV